VLLRVPDHSRRQRSCRGSGSYIDELIGVRLRDTSVVPRLMRDIHGRPQEISTLSLNGLSPQSEEKFRLGGTADQCLWVT
jgi:hypothetical protein